MATAWSDLAWIEDAVANNIYIYIRHWNGSLRWPHVGLGMTSLWPQASPEVAIRIILLSQRAAMN